MPYLNKEERSLIDSGFKCAIKKPGHLNYQITKLLIEYLGDKYDYQIINDILGAIEGAKLEFYRRIAAKYENKKIAINGDVY